MRMPKTKWIFLGIAVIIILLLYKFWYLDYKIKAYEDIPDLSNEYNVEAEMPQALEKLNTDIEPATVYTKDPTKNAIALTFDGLPDPATTDKLLDLIERYDMKVTFFVEGSNAAGDKESVLKLYEQGITIGNYTYTGVQYLDKLPQDAILEQLLRTQKALDVLTGTEPELFKAPDTSFVVPLLQVAAAANLKSAVKTDVFINKDAVKNDVDAVNFINSVPQGSIVSLRIGTPTNIITYQEGKIDDKPAVDKQPNLALKEEKKDTAVHQNIVDVVERLFKAIQQRGIQTVEIRDLREIERVDILTPPAAPTPSPSTSGKVAMLFDYIADKADNILFNRALAATADYNQLRRMNNHKLAENPKMIYTTEQSVCFAFAGLTKPEVVYKTLDYLAKNNIKGTFFVMENEMRANPQMVQDIINSGNEVAIGLRSLKDSNFFTVCKQIDYMQNQFASMGVQTNLVMQPWGQITDETREAVSAMNCQMVSYTLNIVTSKHQDYTSALDVVNEQFGKYVYSVGRGWIIYFRLDFYNDNDLVVNVMDLVKRHKVDNIAYNSFYDDPKINSNNDSAYTIKSIGDVLKNKQALYDFDENKRYDDVDLENSLQLQGLNFNEYIHQRYIGNEAVEDSNVFGFNVEEKQFQDISGKIHTDKPVVFFTFDDWGTDAAINHLLYVLRKHNVKATFFVLTHNIMQNPNLLRAIALDGHDIASHSEFHNPMDDSSFETAYEGYLLDYGISYNKLKYLAGDIILPDGTAAFKPYFRAPTLTISKAGFKALYDTGYEYIVSGSYSTHDYDQPSLESMINDIKKGIYDRNGKVKNGAVLVMHMSDLSVYTPTALDLLLTINEQRADNDPAKFTTLPLSAYLKNNYDQSDYSRKNNDLNSRPVPEINPIGSENSLYHNTGY
ncbi:polysaccharide deacetylase family protein [Megamonas hypermegale]|uniref:polysaccharide deacetylase family protein n=1 Tax=Megamonas hypermegale TaxID=158847 RepID=UPI00195AF325|nr:polysaccharide deacetylase family protein [Megamonas hypermegale]MBM6761780.1 polysaccharide deacetylase family protein [Megamonas hypermegale]